MNRTNQVRRIERKHDKSSQEKREENVTELREGLLKMINGVLDVSDAVIFNHVSATVFSTKC